VFYWTRRYITVNTRDRPWPLSSDRWIQTTSPHIYVAPVFTPSSYLRLGLENYLFPSGIRPIICVSSPHACYMTLPNHPCLIPQNIWKMVRIKKFLIIQFSPACSYFLLLKSKYSFTTLNLCSSLIMRYQVSRTWKTTGRAIGVLGFDSRWGLGNFHFTTASRTAPGPPSLLSNRYQGLFPWG
jgi:hypothetical protein